jgi:hypothetical protein
MPRVGQVRCADLITAQVGSFSFLFLAQVGPGLSSAPFEVWLIVNPAHRRPLLKFGSLSALARCQPILEFGPLSTLFKSTFTNHLPLSLATHQPLSSPETSTIYKSFLASTTAVIIVSYFKLNVAEYSTLSLRGDVKIFYIILVYYVALYVLGTSFSASTLFSFSFLFYILIYISTKIKRRWKGRKEIEKA